MSGRSEARAAIMQNGDHVAFVLLRTVFTVAPILFGLDKFVRILTSDWERYLAPWMNDIIPGDARTAMYIVGVVEIVAGILVAFLPRLGGLVVAVWLLGIIVSLVSVGGYLDIACVISGFSSPPWPSRSSLRDRATGCCGDAAERPAWGRGLRVGTRAQEDGGRCSERCSPARRPQAARARRRCARRISPTSPLMSTSAPRVRSANAVIVPGFREASQSVTLS